MGDGRAEGSSAIGDGGQVATSLTPDPDVDGMHIHIFERLQLEGSYVGDLLNSTWFSSLEEGTISVKNIAYYCTRQGSIEKQNQYTYHLYSTYT